jgi:hypothetical protein
MALNRWNTKQHGHNPTNRALFIGFCRMTFPHVM